MRKNRFNLRNVAIIACLAATTMISGCDKDNGKGKGSGSGGDGNTCKITASNVIDGSTRIVTVKAELGWDTDDDWGYDVIAKTPYKNNGFILELPATIADKYLYVLAEDAPNFITISDRTAKWSLEEFYIEAYGKDDDNIGTFYMQSEDGSSTTDAMWIYVDKNVTIKGEEREIDEGYEEKYIYDMLLKKGWNIVYVREGAIYDHSTGSLAYTFSLTSQRPSDANNFSWYYYDYTNYATSPKSAKSSLAKKSFFRKK